MKEENKNILNEYYNAFVWANGSENAKRLRLKYNKGWFYVSYDVSGNQPCRKEQILRMTDVLSARKKFQ